MGGDEVDRCGIVHRAISKDGGACPPGGAAMASATASYPDPDLGDECWKTDLDKTVEEGARSLDLLVARS
jgi:hypothetical protein